MAITYSLPWALLMWSYVISYFQTLPSAHIYGPAPPRDRMVTFFIALLLFCYTISNTSTRVFVAVISVIVAILILWCIHLARNSTEDFYVWHNSKLALRRTRDDLFKRIKELGHGLLSPFSTRHTPEVAHGVHAIAERQGDFGGV
jgi:hypothetical protein